MNTEQETPLERTRTLRDISVTERSQFRKCHRRWKLQTIDNLEPKQPTWALSFGTGIHSALEAYYASAKSHRDANMDAAFEHWYNVTSESLDEYTPASARDELWELRELGREMLSNYRVYDQQRRGGVGDVLMVEGARKRGAKHKIPVSGNPRYPKGAQPIVDKDAGRLLVPIVDPDTLEPLEGTPCLSMKIDLLTMRDTPHRGLWIVDHKTSASPYSDRGLDFNDQATGYCYGVYRWTGQVPRGVMFNILLKQTPSVPRILKDGSLSAAKNQLTTADAYRDALKEHGLMSASGRISSEPHAACLDTLLARGWQSFFQRLEPTRSEHELLSFEQRLYVEYQDMGYALDNPEFLYPNQDERTCPYCPVAPICQAMEDGSDVESVMTRFRQSEDRKA